MNWLPPRSTLTYTLVPYTSLCRSSERYDFVVGLGGSEDVGQLLGQRQRLGQRGPHRHGQRQTRVKEHPGDVAQHGSKLPHLSAAFPIWPYRTTAPTDAPSRRQRLNLPVRSRTRSRRRHRSRLEQIRVGWNRQSRSTDPVNLLYPFEVDRIHVVRWNRGAVPSDHDPI